MVNAVEGRKTDGASETVRGEVIHCDRADRREDGSCEGRGVDLVDGWEGYVRCPNRRTFRCPEATADDWAFALGEMAFPPKYCWPDGDYLLKAEPRAKPVIDMLEAYWGNLGEHIERNEGFILSGDVGTAKSFLLALTALHVRPWTQKGDVLYALSGNLFSAFYDKDRSVAWPYRTCEFLLLDDLGVEHRHEWGLAEFGLLVEFRHTHGLPTCLTTNLSVEDLGRLSGLERPVDRWREQCEGRVISLGYETLRGRRDVTH